MFELAFKNLLFYKGRTFITFVLIFFSTLLFIVFVALMHGSHSSMLQNALKVYTGAIEIYKKGYRDVGGSEYLIRDVDSIEAILSQIKGIKNFTARYETYGLLANKNLSTATMIAGVNPQKEQSMSELKRALIKGDYLSEKDYKCLYAGVDLVKKLELKVGDSVAFIGSASDNSFAADMFKLCGIFRTGSFEFDSMTSFVTKKSFDALMYSQNMASYISVSVENLDDVEKIKDEITHKVSDDIEVLTWKTLMESMVQAMEVDSIFGYISLSLFFVVIFFVVMIFGFINVTSRVNEFGVLRCLGLSKRSIRLLLFYEMCILATVAILVAAPIGAYTAYYFSLHPIVMEGISETYKEYGVISDEIPLSFNVLTIFWNVLVIYILSFLSIVYPISYINRFRPVEAVHHV